MSHSLNCASASSPGPDQFMTGMQNRIRFGRRRLSDFTDLAPINNAREGTKLTTAQKDIIKKGWKQANRKGSNEPGEWILCRAMEMEPELKDLFDIEPGCSGKALKHHPAVVNHARILCQLLDMVVESLDALDDSLGPLLVSYGSNHVALMRSKDFKNQWWDVISEAMCSFAVHWKMKAGKWESVQAWRLLISFIMDKFKQGFDMQQESHTIPSRKSSLGSNWDSSKPTI